MDGRRAKTLLSFSCTHFPLADETALAWVLDQIEDVKPDYIIHLGDLYEADGASRWGSEYGWTLADEYRAADRWLANVRRAAPEATRIFLPGNHDDNILAEGRIDKSIRGLVGWDVPQYDRSGEQVNRELLEHWAIGAKYENHPARGVWRFGQVCYTHGYSTSAAGLKKQTIRFAWEFGLVVSGHTHRPTENVERLWATTTLPLRYWKADVGCLRELSPEYVRRQDHDLWGHAVNVTHAVPVKSPRRTCEWESEQRVLRLGVAYQ